MPSAFDSVLVITLVATLRMAIAAAGTTACVASVTEPVTDALSPWPGSNTQETANRRTARIVIDMDVPPLPIFIALLFNLSDAGTSLQTRFPRQYIGWTAAL